MKVIPLVGITFTISYAGPAFTWDGGGVQYQFIDEIGLEWFRNKRSFD